MTAALPEAIFQTPLVRPLIKEGDSIFGSASVYCPICVRGHTYLFEIIWGESGWYAEIPEVANGTIFVPKHRGAVADYVEVVRSVMPSNRIQIRQ